MLLLAVPLVAACCGRDQTAGEIRGPGRSVAALPRRDAGAAAAPGERQILFGDLHVHTTYSIDAFVFTLPPFVGKGVHPPADACDFARYCSAIDFFSINDHAEGLTPERWRKTKESIRQCNARAQDPHNPDLVAFNGWEWTQMGWTPETHYGHKNVIFPGLTDDVLPARPISSLPDDVLSRAPSPWLLRGLQVLATPAGRGYADFLWWIERLAAMPNCEKGVDTRKLPPDCRENATTPEELFEKLDQWGFDYLVIPHGLTWGVHAPIGARLDNQLRRKRVRPERQRLIEVYSGHGNGEEYRRWRGVRFDAGGNPICPEATADFLPCCRRAGEIMRSRCGGLPEAACEARVKNAMHLALEANVAPHLVFPDTRPEDWLDCDQCRDCFKPAFALRPGESAQYGLAISNFEERDAKGELLRFRWGFIASSDNHQARAGTGYKQFGRHAMTETDGVRSELADHLLRRVTNGSQKDPRRPQGGRRDPRSFGSLLDVERVASFMYPGGLVAVHAAGRDRKAIWEALKRKEVYGTSGPRILLWFDLLNGPRGAAPMGSEVQVREAPRFAVRAVGSFVQKPGCPEESVRGLSAERLQSLCVGECYNPGDRRHLITAIEVVRIRPQAAPGENVDTLIEDPWRHFDCPPDPSGCRVTFTDPDYPASGRDAVYYVRALQEETPAVNGANYRTEFDADGNAVRVTPCNGNYRTAFDDDCLAPVRERAWSSPIFVNRR